jgi:hypothetical protein
MRQPILITFALIVALTVLAAPIPPDAKKPTFYFPVEIGTKWVYVWDDNREDIREITKVEEKEGAKIVTVSKIEEGKKPTPMQVVSVTEKELILLREFGDELKPPAAWLEVPCKVGDKWNCGSTWHEFKIGAEAVVRRMVEIEVPAGKFNTIEVRRTYALNGTCGGYYWTYWFAPGVGRVQMKDYFDGCGIPYAVLKSFTPGK